MNKFFISRLLVALLFLVPVVVFFAPSVDTLESERRKAAAFPDVPAKIRTRAIKQYFQDIDRYFADRFPMRTSFLGFIMALHEVGGDSLDREKCFRGQENWLFLGNSYAKNMDKLQGLWVLSEVNIKRKVDRYTNINEAAKQVGSEFYLFVGPNKSSIYPEYLPPVVIPAKQRYISPLVEALQAKGLVVYDPTNKLLEAKKKGLVYYRTDTHWNNFGAYEAFEGFRDVAGLPALPALSFSETPPYAGDLVAIGGYDSFPLSNGDNFTLNWETPPNSQSIADNEKQFINAQSVSGKTAWVFGDSFGGALQPYFKAMFKEVLFFTHDEFDAALASIAPKPDMMVWVIVERNLAD